MNLIAGYSESNHAKAMKAGITGHQQIGSDLTINWVRETLTALIADEHVCEGYTCLAIGADQLFAEILLELRIPYVTIIPASDYITTFQSADDKTRYQHLLKHSAHVHQEPWQKSTEQAFFDAGKKVVHCSDVLFAVWNGKPAKGLGGTADVVTYALEQGKRVIHLNTSSRICTGLYQPKP